MIVRQVLLRKQQCIFLLKVFQFSIFDDGTDEGRVQCLYMRICVAVFFFFSILFHIFDKVVMDGPMNGWTSGRTVGWIYPHIERR